MPAAWVANEMKDLDLNDKRLNDRLTQVLSQLGQRPTASIPAACGGYAETAAAYRFFDNDKVDFERVLAPHIEATRRRMAEQPVVILAQDTTEIDLTRPEQQVAGVGRLDYASRRGLFLHPLHGFTPDGTPLGTVHATTWTRDDEPLPSKAERYRQNKHTPIEDKESHRWIDALRKAGEESQRAPDTQFVCAADSEADIYELLIEAQRHDLDWIVRGCQNRILAEEGAKPRENKAQQHLLREQVLSRDVLFTHTVAVRSRRAKISGDDRGRHKSRDSRTAEVEVRVAEVALRPPWRYGQKLPGVTVNVVLVSEINAPADDTPLEWMLLTNLPVADEEQVRTVIEYYSVRWMIEVYQPECTSSARLYQLAA